MSDVNSLDASQLKQDANLEKIVHKRRSSIFQSRPISYDEREGTQLAENEKSVGAEETEHASKKPREETFNLEEYTISLRNERKEWIETLKRRKAQRRSLASRKLSLENQGQPLDLNVLSDSEKDFVSTRPNYEYIYKNNKKLSDMATKVSILNELVYGLNQRFILQLEKKLCKVREKVIEISES